MSQESKIRKLDEAMNRAEVIARYLKGLEASGKGSKSEVTTFELQVRGILGDLGDMLIAKNKAYGNSALEPVRVFSRADAIESLNIRIDDKLSRITRGTDYPGEDTIDDLLGYLVLLKIARQEVEAR